MVTVTIDYGNTHGATDPHEHVKKTGTKLTSGREAHAVVRICPDKAYESDLKNHYPTSSVKNEMGHKNSTKTALLGRAEGPHHKLRADTETSVKHSEGPTVSSGRTPGATLCYPPNSNFEEVKCIVEKHTETPGKENPPTET